MDDRTLLHRYATTRDREAFAALARRHVDMVYGVARRRVADAHLAEDVTQAVFLMLAQKAAALDGRRIVLAGWLYKATTYAAANAIRRQRRRELHEARFAAAADAERRASGSLAEATIDPARIEAAMDTLPAGDRDAIVLRYYEDAAPAAVATALGISEHAAKKRLTRALAKLRTAMTTRGIVVTASAEVGALVAANLAPTPTALAASVATIAGVASTGAITTLAAGAIHMMTLAKLKVALVAIAAVLFTGATITAVTAIGRSPAANQSQAANATTSAVPPAAPVAPGRVMSAVRYGALIEAALAQRIRDAAKPVASQSIGFETHLCDAGVLQPILGPAIDTPQFISLLPDMQVYARPSPGESAQPLHASLARQVEIRPREGSLHYYSGNANVIETVDFRRRVHLRIDGPDVRASLSGDVYRPANVTSEVHGKLSFDGDLAPGQCLVVLGRLGPQPPFDPWQLFVYQVTDLDEGQATLAEQRTDPAWWIKNGPAVAARQAAEGLAWAASARPVASESAPNWQTTLPGGATVGVVAVSRPDVHPFRWWSPDGTPVAVPPAWCKYRGAFAVALVATDPAMKATDTTYGSYSNWDLSSYTEVRTDTKRITFVGAVPDAVDDPTRGLDVNIGVGDGEWTDAGPLKLNEPLIVDGGKFEMDKFQKLQGSPTDGRSPGSSIVHVNFADLPDIETTAAFTLSNGIVRLFRGGTYPRLGRPSGSSSGYLAQIVPVIPEDVYKVSLYTRPRRWVTIGEIATDPIGTGAIVRDVAPNPPVPSPTSAPVTPAADSPEETMKRLADAMDRGDWAVVRRTMIGETPEEQGKLDAHLDGVQQTDRMLRAAKGRFGLDEMKRALPPYLLDYNASQALDVTFRIEGDIARPTTGPGTDVFYLRRREGRWVMVMPDATWIDADDERRRARMMSELADGVENGTLADAFALRDAYNAKDNAIQKQQVTPAAAPTTVPATRPAS